jgi:transaldolase
VSENPLARLRDFGQSVWCDDIGREFLLSGGFEVLIQRDGVCGLTSNPTIFHRAITSGTAYDADIARLMAMGASTIDILESLMFTDVRTAADQLWDVFEASEHRDGWVSVEVAPDLAYDTQGTVTEVKRVQALVGRTNVMVKVPGTQEGVAAVRDLVGLGYCINVTLIFSLDRYAEVMDAYLDGLETLVARRKAGERVPALADIHGVASFFVSRIDTAVDRRLDSLGAPSDMRGKTAVANAKAAYLLFRERFSGPRWEALLAGGANLQRPLWASTSTKDPVYSDIMYVQELIGRDTVNTMPLATMDAYRDHGRPAETITDGVDEAVRHLKRLEDVGISLPDITAQLEKDGVQAFSDSFEALRIAVESKRAAEPGWLDEGGAPR